MAFKMRYTDGMLLERYYKVPRDSEEQYEKEHNRFDSKWLEIHIESGKRYGEGDMRTVWNDFNETNQLSMHKSMRYSPSGLEVYGLQEYKQEALSEHGINYDKYIYLDSLGNVTSVFKCHDNYLGGDCEQRFLLLPELKARAIVTYKRGNLKDWQLIQEQVSHTVKSYIIDTQ